MAAVQVQKKSYRSTAAASGHSITPTSTPTTGNLLILPVCADATVSTPSGWLPAISAVDFVGLYIFYKTSAGTETSISVTPSGSAHTAIDFLEYSGMAASSQLDKTASNSAGTSTTTQTSGTTAATAQADELCIAVGGSGGGTAFTVTSWSNSFTEELDGVTTGSGTLIGLGTASRIVSATGTYTTTITFGATINHPGGCIATFKIAAGGGGAALNVNQTEHMAILQAVKAAVL